MPGVDGNQPSEPATRTEWIRPGIESDAQRELRQQLGFSPRQFATAKALAGSDEAVLSEYTAWKSGIRARAAELGDMTSTQYAALLETSLEYLAQLKLRRMLTWTDRRDNADGKEPVVTHWGFVYTLADVDNLIELSENWLRGGSEVVGGRGSRGPLGHLFVRWLQRKHGGEPERRIR